MKRLLFIVISVLCLTAPRTWAQKTDSATLFEAKETIIFPDSVELTNVYDSIGIEEVEVKDRRVISPYALPYSVNGKSYDWKRLWNNSAVLGGAFVGTLFVLELLPEDATSWNRKELKDVPMFRRWYNHVIKQGPEWDHDKFYFNYILHPYAGAVYYMSARTCGFNLWQSLLYCSIVSTVGWEFGVEAFMERPSIQDIFVTPLIGACFGEGFYHIKRYLVNHDYCILGSKILGNIIGFLIDPVNELTGLWLGNSARKVAREKSFGTQVSLVPVVSPGFRGVTLAGRF